MAIESILSSLSKVFVLLTEIGVDFCKMSGGIAYFDSATIVCVLCLFDTVCLSFTCDIFTAGFAGPAESYNNNN